MRRTFNLTERCAILLLEKLAREGRPIPYKMQQKLSAEEICSYFDADHWPTRYELGGSTHPSNGQMLVNRKGARRLSWIYLSIQLDEHGHKTNTKDKPAIAKSKRIIAKRAKDSGENSWPPLANLSKADYGHTEKFVSPRQKLRGPGFRKRPKGTKYNWKKGGRLERVE